MLGGRGQFCKRVWGRRERGCIVPWLSQCWAAAGDWPRVFIFQTQPVPNPIAYFMHRSPWWFHQFETLFNHFIELVVPFFIFLGRRMCIVHGVLQILFQVRCSWRCFPHPHPLAARSIPRGQCAGAGALRAALCRAAAHPARTGAAPKGTDSRSQVKSSGSSESGWFRAARSWPLGSSHCPWCVAGDVLPWPQVWFPFTWMAEKQRRTSTGSDSAGARRPWMVRINTCIINV